MDRSRTSAQMTSSNLQATLQRLSPLPRTKRYEPLLLHKGRFFQINKMIPVGVVALPDE